MNKFVEFLKKIKPSKRRLIQLYAALLTNSNAKGFFTGRIYTGATKSVCVPSMNCYSCPGAIGACPLGSLQNTLTSADHSSLFYVLGIIMLFGVLCGRFICGWLCPVGLFQEWLYKIKTFKLHKNKATRILSYFKYVLLVVFVIMIPLMYSSQSNGLVVPAFCKYICPVGTFEGAIGLLVNPSNTAMFAQLGPLFTWKMTLLVLIVLASIFIYRFFCRFLCPLGAIYGLFNSIAVFGVKVDETKCTHCSSCISSCKMDVKKVGDHECIQCGECMKECAVHAIDWKLVQKSVHAQLHPEEQLATEAAIATVTTSVQPAIEEKKIAEEKPAEKPVERKLGEKKKFPVVKTVIISIMMAVLIFAFVFYNFIDVKTTVDVNEKLSENTVVNLMDGNEKKLDQKRASYFYFYNDFDQDYFNLVKEFASNDGMDFYFVSNFITYETNKQYMTMEKPSNFYFAFDGKDMSFYHTFTTMKYDFYSVCINSENTVFLSNNSKLTNDVFTSIVLPVISGKKVGNQVGDICPSADMESIYSTDTTNIIQYRGKVVVLNFWYIDCGPCKMELPGFSNLQDKYPDDVKVLVVHENSSYNKSNVTSFMDDPTSVAANNVAFKNLNLTYLMDSNPSYYSALGGDDSYPMTVIIDQQGVIQLVQHGSLPETNLFAAVEPLLKK